MVTDRLMAFNKEEAANYLCCTHHQIHRIGFFAPRGGTKACTIFITIGMYADGGRLEGRSAAGSACRGPERTQPYCEEEDQRLEFPTIVDG
ncbi:hypothetical protein PGT21_021963 [Puccinia graminis f. sp. tritici]|uniref:Uncharacterized protein n=1 Tax=Puccinia graminis f. sp. tritici TaxID=56615 RepID=A0A5B0RL31_PUCGR|nr:hypothetical protein PGT21_021963 [Puccinia graminis f. sp. tritici]KAA1125755.1 hypothetical protein PGTUg99_014811 [Puccinia graminis f. sp. tritici]